MTISNTDPNHNISHCQNLLSFKNVHIIKHNYENILKTIRDNGILKKLIDGAFIGVNTILCDNINLLVQAEVD